MCKLVIRQQLYRYTTGGVYSSKLIIAVRNIMYSCSRNIYIYLSPGLHVIKRFISKETDPVQECETFANFDYTIDYDGETRAGRKNKGFKACTPSIRLSFLAGKVKVLISCQGERFTVKLIANVLRRSCCATYWARSPALKPFLLLAGDFQARGKPCLRRNSLVNSLFRVSSIP